MPTLAHFSGEDRPGENIFYIADPNGEIAIEHVKYGGNMLEDTILRDGVLQAIETP